MSYTLDFVEEPGGSVRLSLDSDGIVHVEKETNIPLPEHYKQYAESFLSDGRRPVGEGKYGNITITLSLLITADTIGALDAKIRDIITEVTRENWLKFTPEGASSALYYHTFPYDKIDPGTLQKRIWRLNKLTYGFVVQLESELPVGEEETLEPVKNLIQNWSFEERSGNNFYNWDEAVEHGSGTASVTAYTDITLFGNTACRLKTTTDDGEASVQTTDYISVNSAEHYYFELSSYRLDPGAGPVLFARIYEYDLMNKLVGTIDLTLGAVETTFIRTGAVINPAGGVTSAFVSSCAKVKIKIYTDDYACDVLIDGVIFTNSDKLSWHLLNSPCGIIYSPSDLKGDLPAPCDIYITKPDDYTKEMTATYLGSRREYYSLYQPIAFCGDLGSYGYSGYNYTSGDIYAYHQVGEIGTELLSNSGFETISGTAGSNSETWTGWTVSGRESDVYVIASKEKVKQGTYSVKFYSEDSGVVKTIEMTSDYIPITYTNAHYASAWYILENLSGNGFLGIYVLCYNDSDDYLGVKTLLSTRATRLSWTPCYLAVAASSFPSGTTKIKIKITTKTNAYKYHNTITGEKGIKSDIAWIDSFSFKASGDILHKSSVNIPRITGRVKPLWHYCYDSVEQDKQLSLHGRINYDDTEYTPWQEINTMELDLYDAWRWQELGSPFTIPNFATPSDQDSPDLHQDLRLRIDEEITTGDMRTDIIALIPTDYSYAQIGAEDNRYLIVDSTSDCPAFLKSYDGTKANSIIMDMGKIAKPFKIDPQNGMNMAILQVWTHNDGPHGDAHQSCHFLSDITIKYRPRYLVVP